MKITMNVNFPERISPERFTHLLDVMYAYDDKQHRSEGQGQGCKNVDTPSTEEHRTRSQTAA
jgi:hypothetical protein